MPEPNTEDKHKVNEYEREEHSSSSPIASSRPIGKAEAADCISPVEGRELRSDDHDLEQKTVSFCR